MRAARPSPAVTSDQLLSGSFVIAGTPSAPTFHPEYGRFMLESTPGSPYTGEIRDLLSVESNMRYR